MLNKTGFQVSLGEVCINMYIYIYTSLYILYTSIKTVL